MVSKDLVIKNKMGFHMRPANIFVTQMTKYASNVFIIFDGKEINGKSIMNIMAACIKCGAKITIKCDGEDEKAMLEEAVKLVEDGFGEE